jgi:hypothetical protein
LNAYNALTLALRDNSTSSCDDVLVRNEIIFCKTALKWIAKKGSQSQISIFRSHIIQFMVFCGEKIANEGKRDRDWQTLSYVVFVQSLSTCQLQLSSFVRFIHSWVCCADFSIFNTWWESSRNLNSKIESQKLFISAFNLFLCFLLCYCTSDSTIRLKIRKDSFVFYKALSWLWFSRKKKVKNDSK